ncbi:MAG: hypothetical protein US49_C0002G0147 [candidate division TM6 bacterium GW2011_GWF2_37_49]|nr:MAG: hypothetical protein US49_C0002G0147 [candidate division TM6 bacterium GW2011_GWF2_37_49]
MKYSKMIFIAISFVAVSGYALAMTESEDSIDTTATQIAEEPTEVAPVAEAPVQETVPAEEVPSVPAKVDEVVSAKSVEEEIKPEAEEVKPEVSESKSQDEADLEDFFKDLAIDDNSNEGK